MRRSEAAAPRPRAAMIFLAAAGIVITATVVVSVAVVTQVGNLLMPKRPADEAVPPVTDEKDALLPLEDAPESLEEQMTQEQLAHVVSG